MNTSATTAEIRAAAKHFGPVESAESSIDAAILELQRARATLRTDQEFSVARLGESRLCIAAARIAIVCAPSPIRRRIRTGRAAQVFEEAAV